MLHRISGQNAYHFRRLNRIALPGKDAYRFEGVIEKVRVNLHLKAFDLRGFFLYGELPRFDLGHIGLLDKTLELPGHAVKAARYPIELVFPRSGIETSKSPLPMSSVASTMPRTRAAKVREIANAEAEADTTVKSMMTTIHA
jgi:hypothetical protein